MNGESTQLSIAVTKILHSSVYYPEESFFLFFSLLYLSCSCHSQLSLLTPIEFKESQKSQAAASQLYSWDRLQGIAQPSLGSLGSQRPGAPMSLHPCWANGKKAPCPVPTNKPKSALKGMACLLTTQMASISGLSEPLLKKAKEEISSFSALHEEF